MSTSSSSSSGAFSSSSSSDTSSFTSSSYSSFSSYYEDSSFSLSSSSCNQFSLEEINVATNNFDKTRILGEGGEATVYKAEVYLNSKTEKTWVAIKHLDKNSTEFVKEIRIVSKIQHPYVVALHGYCNESGEKILIYEFMKNGSLADYVKQDSVCLSWTQRLNICLGAAYGLQHLHKQTTEFRKGIIHRDVKPANILLDENWVAKVSDFGMFKLSESAQIQSTMITGSRKGTPGYFAPEYYISHQITRKTDVYAFGVVLFEVLCRKKPWDRGDVSWFREENEDLGVWARENVDTEIKMQVSSYSLKAFTDVVGKCLQENPRDRPTMDGVVQSLQLAIKYQESEDLNTSMTVLRLEEKPSHMETWEYLLQKALSKTASEKGMTTQPAIMSTEETLNALVKYIIQDIGFSQGKPVAAFTIHKCLVDWKSFEAERTSVFDRLSGMLSSALEDASDNNDCIAYWLCNASSLFFLVHRGLIFPSATTTFSVQALRQSPRANLDFPRYEAKNPVLRFTQQLNSLVEVMCSYIWVNFFQELQSSNRLLIQSSWEDEDGKAAHWENIIESLNDLLTTLKKNYVQSILVQKIFSQIFSYINERIFNSILYNGKYCNKIRGKLLRDGLTKFELWCAQATKECSGLSLDELKHVKQAAQFLVRKNKHNIAYADLIDVCPDLSVQQLYRLCCLFRAPHIIAAPTINPNTMNRLRRELTEDSNSDAYLLKGDYSSKTFSLSGDEIISYFHQHEDFSYVQPAYILLENPTFLSLWMP